MQETMTTEENVKPPEQNRQRQAPKICTSLKRKSLKGDNSKESYDVFQLRLDPNLRTAQKKA
jgi:hypothetical protein